jgi:hypothetical protein
MSLKLWLKSCQFEQNQNQEDISSSSTLCLSVSGFTFICVFASKLLLLMSYNLFMSCRREHKVDLSLVVWDDVE